MQTFDILKKSGIDKTSFRNLSIIEQYDLQIKDVIQETFSGQIDLSNNWQIGCIVGNSGTGKTTLAREIFGDNYMETQEYGDKSVLDEMPENCLTKDISRIFNSVGFSSPKSWLKPYGVLSNGERMRIDLAKALLSNKELIVMDEFTSVVDRQVAKTMSFVVNKNIRKSDKRFVAVTCHYDIIDWLEPDWVFDTNTMKQIFIKKNDQAYNYQFTSVQQWRGKFLRNIII